MRNCFANSKKGENFSWGYSILTIWTFDNIENKYSLFRGEDCMKKFCISLGEHIAVAINFEKKKNFLLTKKELKSHQDLIVWYICRKKFSQKNLEICVT